MKKIISFLLVSIMILCSNFSPVFASNNNDVSINTRGIVLKDIDKMPEGVTPIIINTQEEFDAFLRNRNQIKKELKNIELSSSELTNVSRRVVGDVVGNKTVQIHNSKKITPVTNLNIYADVDVYLDDVEFPSVITGCSNIYTTLTGVTLSVSLNENVTRSKISRNGRSVTASADVTIDSYIIIEGIGKIYSEDDSISVSYGI